LKTLGTAVVVNETSTYFGQVSDLNQSSCGSNKNE
jgi:hypothetical protein